MNLRNKMFWAWTLFLTLLLLSHLWRHFFGETEPKPNQRVIEVQEISGQNKTGRTIKMAYWDIQPEKPSHNVPLLLIHGSPLPSRTFKDLIQKVGKEYRILCPDLPGFGRSSRIISNYSIESHASYLIALLEKLEIPRVHILSYSQGGGVALHMADRTPEKVISLIHYSAIGVQELELLGDYYLNHALYALQLGCIWILQECLPHFGLMDHALINTSYARNFFDSDQRPLRNVLKKYNAPMLLIHGERDISIPLIAAKEHARLAPQSNLIRTRGGHLQIFSTPPSVIEEIINFTTASEKKEAVTRTTAQKNRLENSLLPFGKGTVLKPEGLLLFIFLFLISMATFITEDFTCISAGLMVANGNLSFWHAIFACMFGIVFWDVMLFLVGKHMGRPLLNKPIFKRLIKPEDLERTEHWFEAQGIKVIFISRFIPGTRFPTFVVAGISGMKTWKFALFFLLASALWTPLIVGLSTLLGKRMQQYLQHYQQYALWIVLGFILLIIFIKKIVLPLFNWRGRRLLLSSWRRKIRWEFWPLRIFYLPVFFYIVWLSIKHGFRPIFSAANPAIPHSGFIGESKSKILTDLNSEYTARFKYLDNPVIPDILDWMKQNDLNFPIVLKPDVGERGQNVHILKDIQGLEKISPTLSGSWIAQEFAPGKEFGIFYFRFPNEAKGHIFAITDKIFTFVTGDGRHTLEQLILKDERTVCQASLYLKTHASELFEIPPPGKKVHLVEIGTHCRGALFKDGSQWITPELEDKIDIISQGYEGFYFGRYDVRTPEPEAFKKGANFQILELNGVTSEATNIYDPINFIWDAYAILFKQWRIAFKIGAQNLERGASITSPLSLLKQWIRYAKN